MGVNVDIHTICWCPLTGPMTSLKGKIVGTRQADALLVVGCEASDCPVPSFSKIVSAVLWLDSYRLANTVSFSIRGINNLAPFPLLVEPQAPLAF
jgi:hypothetical protein